MKQTKPGVSQILMGGEKGGEAVAAFFFLDHGLVPRARDTEQEEASIVHKLHRHVKEAVCSFNITVINMCIYWVSL